LRFGRKPQPWRALVRETFVFNRLSAYLLRVSPEVILSCPPEIPTRVDLHPLRIFKMLTMAKSVLYTKIDEVARNGALLRINFGQRFS
jgi:hypothetical protein